MAVTGPSDGIVHGANMSGHGGQDPSILHRGTGGFSF